MAVTWGSAKILIRKNQTCILPQCDRCTRGRGLRQHVSWSQKGVSFLEARCIVRSWVGDTTTHKRTFAGGKNAESSEAPGFSCRFRSRFRASDGASAERIRYHRRNHYRFQWRCNCERDDHTHQSRHRRETHHGVQPLRRIHVRKHFAWALPGGDGKERL